MFKKIAIAVAVATAVGGVASNAIAGSSTTNLAVTATVTTKCTGTSTPVAFGAYDPLSATDALATGTLAVTCTKGATGVTIGLGLGAHAAGSVRNMLNAGSGDVIAYELYQPSAMTAAAACPGTLPGTATIWSNAGGGLVTPSGVTWGATSPASFNVCGYAVKNQDVTGSTAGTAYSDTVVATFNF